MLLQPGQVFAGYTILRVLGAGGMGKVYLATHPRLPREDALKVLPAEFTDDAEYRARFTREADLAASLSHPHIVSIHDRGEHDGQFWISMDYVAGTDAARLLAERYQAGMPADEVAAIVTAVASALDYAHHRGLLHRDVKPANILLTDPDAHARRIYLADFGVARRIDDSAKLTATNVAVGTVAYAAPEQLRGHTIDGRADQYALACSAFELLTGTPPYTDPNPTVVIAQHVSAPPPSIATRRPELAHLDPIFTTALAKDPNDRYPTCTDFATQLTTHLYEDTRITQPAIAITAPVQRAPHRKRLTQRPAVVIAALVAVALVVIGAVFAGVRLNQSHDRATPAPPTVTTTAAPP
ncbi:serine/threonine-protein kinase, partial [Mycobacterium kubicae]